MSHHVTESAFNELWRRLDALDMRTAKLERDDSARRNLPCPYSIRIVNDEGVSLRLDCMVGAGHWSAADPAASPHHAIFPNGVREVWWTDPK